MKSLNIFRFQLWRESEYFFPFPSIHRFFPPGFFLVFNFIFTTVRFCVISSALIPSSPRLAIIIAKQIGINGRTGISAVSLLRRPPSGNAYVFKGSHQKKTFRNNSASDRYRKGLSSALVRPEREPSGRRHLLADLPRGVSGGDRLSRRTKTSSCD